MNTLPELLAPAGNLESAVTAFESGADAVYAGLGKFNARERADNFSEDDMARLAEYAKARDKKYYLTFNTLIKEDELEEAARMINRARAWEPDALIVQDIGLTRLIRKAFPEITIHSSTQMGIHNSTGLRFAAQQGISRVILERQVSLEELEILSRQAAAMKPAMELEVFIHGALCCSLSGRCLFSSWIGGWSGNRGRCKQPCRRRYHTTGTGDKQSGFFFSTQDLYSLDLIPQYQKWGISSLKIEGRLKKPDYIRALVGAYRHILDSPTPDSHTTLGEAKRILSGSYGRRWSHGFATGEDRKTLIQANSLGVSGQLIGEVKGWDDRGLQISLSRRLRQGDRIRIQSRQGDEGPALTAHTLLLRGRPVSAAGEKQIITLPANRDLDIPQQGLVFRIGESRQETKLNREAMPLFEPLVHISLALALKADGITVTFPDHPALEPWSYPLCCEEARKSPLDREKLEELFSASGRKKLKPRFTSVTIEGSYFVPPSQLKELRRQFWDHYSPQIEELVSTDEEEVLRAAALEALLEKPPFPRGSQGDNQMITIKGKRKEDAKGDVNRENLFRLKGLDEFRGTSPEPWEEWELPYYCDETRIQALKKEIKKILKAGAARFRITAPYQIPLIQEVLAERPPEKKPVLTAGFPLPLTNSWAFWVLQEAGASQGQAWVELEEKAVASLKKKSPLPLEIYRRGRPLLLTTRAELIPQGGITDSRGKAFIVLPPGREFPWKTPLYQLFPADLLWRPRFKGASQYRDYSGDTIPGAPRGKQETTELFNWDKELM